VASIIAVNAWRSR